MITCSNCGQPVPDIGLFCDRCGAALTKQDVSVFIANDTGYVRWLAQNPDGYVLNCQRSVSPGYLILHRARCRTIRGKPTRETANSEAHGGNRWTGPYIKVCAATTAAIDAWATRRAGRAPDRCKLCQ